MALLRRCLLELRARQGNYDSHQQLGFLPSFDCLSEVMLVHESGIDSAPSSDIGTDFSMHRQPERFHRMVDALIDAVQVKGVTSLMHKPPFSSRTLLLKDGLEKHVLLERTTSDGAMPSPRAL